MEEPNVITFTDAARQKKVARSTLYRAADRGEINVVSIGSSQAILKDEAWEKWEPTETGGRAVKTGWED
jgi:predicted site-specific integrase-resolvase